MQCNYLVVNAVCLDTTSSSTSSIRRIETCRSGQAVATSLYFLSHRPNPHLGTGQFADQIVKTDKKQNTAR